MKLKKEEENLTNINKINKNIIYSSVSEINPIELMKILLDSSINNELFIDNNEIQLSLLNLKHIIKKVENASIKYDFICLILVFVCRLSNNFKISEVVIPSHNKIDIVFLLIKDITIEILAILQSSPLNKINQEEKSNICQCVLYIEKIYHFFNTDYEISMKIKDYISYLNKNLDVICKNDIKLEILLCSTSQSLGILDERIYNDSKDEILEQVSNSEQEILLNEVILNSECGDSVIKDIVNQMNNEFVINEKSFKKERKGDTSNNSSKAKPILIKSDQEEINFDIYSKDINRRDFDIDSIIENYSSYHPKILKLRQTNKWSKEDLHKEINNKITNLIEIYVKTLDIYNYNKLKIKNIDLSNLKLEKLKDFEIEYSILGIFEYDICIKEHSLSVDIIIKGLMDLFENDPKTEDLKRRLIEYLDEYVSIEEFKIDNDIVIIGLNDDSSVSFNFIVNNTIIYNDKNRNINSYDLYLNAHLILKQIFQVNSLKSIYIIVDLLLKKFNFNHSLFSSFENYSIFIMFLYEKYNIFDNKEKCYIKGNYHYFYNIDISRIEYINNLSSGELLVEYLLYLNIILLYIKYIMNHNLLCRPILENKFKEIHKNFLKEEGFIFNPKSFFWKFLYIQDKMKKKEIESYLDFRCDLYIEIGILKEIRLNLSKEKIDYTKRIDCFVKTIKILLQYCFEIKDFQQIVKYIEKEYMSNK